MDGAVFGATIDMGRQSTPGLWLDLGARDFPSTYRLQQALVAMRRDGRIPDTLVAVEHPACLTLGRAARAKHVLADEGVLAAAEIAVHPCDRGGDVTYHGPGQLVCYGIVDLARRGRDVHAHARRLEEVMMRTAASFGVRTHRVGGLPGVWTSRGKLAAVGFTVRRWITSHGIALNVSPTMDHFSLIVPCGLHDRPVTSVAEILGRRIPMDRVRAALRGHCEDVFGLALADADADEALGREANVC
jgi:lipoyl(octanoyl) transferase